MKMKHYIPALIAFFIGFVFLTASTTSTKQTSQDYKYVGVKKCAGMCHKGDSKGNQLEIWQDSKHSQAFTVLQSPEADKIAQDKGFQTPAAETPQCIKCHVLGKDIDPAELEDTFDKTQGVQCETCHGPGSEYKKITIMKDKEKAMANGLIMHDDKQAFCTTCHNSDSPTFKEFNVDEAWAKIQHTDPNLQK
jgi:excinuclease UvrABC ATPase subunit